MKLRVSLAGLCLAFSHANAGEIPFIQCPQELPVQQDVKTPVSDEWNIAEEAYSRNSLEYILISMGKYPDRQTGFSVPSEGNYIPHVGDLIYYDNLVPNKDGIHDYWAVCRYFASNIELVKKIPTNATRCEVKINSDVTVPDGVTIKCFNTPRKAK
jgi:hypothetical protein